MRHFTWLGVIVLSVQVLLMGYFFLFSRYGYIRVLVLQKEIKELDDKIEIVGGVVSDLKKNVQLWKDDDFYTEKRARESLALSRPGEITVFVDNL